MKNNIENNKLIADFMGCRYDENRNSHEDSEYYYEDSELEYHFNWNWLMEVVERIESLGYDTEIVYRLDDGGHCFYINDSPVFSSQMGSKIESIYQAVVEFIKWYNSAKGNTTDQLSNRDLGQSTII